ncbi:MAG: hypothetical protein IKO65_10010 [Victivallales bacterium]|nr:hypothetical protein [Victivallales bacterium]
MSKKNSKTEKKHQEKLVAVTATLDQTTSKITDHSQPSEAMKIMSAPEKDMLCIIQDEEPPLDYPLHPLKMSYGPDAQEYEIPSEAREAVLQQLYPFNPCPKLTEKRLDIHEQKEFVIQDFRVIRERNRNFLVSPYYPRSGGMVVDWMPIDQDLIVQRAR